MAATFYEMFEEPVLHQSLPCDDLLLLTPEPQSWNSSDSTLVSPVFSPNHRDAIIGINTNSMPAMSVKPAIPLQSLLQDHSVKVERLNRKAKLARENRKRKNCRLQELEAECQDLREEVKKLRQRERDIALNSPIADAPVKNEARSHETVLREQVNDIATRVSNGAEENAELKSAITALQDYLMQKSDHSLAQIRGCLDSVFKQPQKGPEQFLVWILSRKDKSFFEDCNGMWKSLFLKHLSLGEDQLKELEKLGKSAQEIRRGCEQIYELFDTISKLFESVFSQGRVIIDTTTDILSSEQIAKFIKWVADNQICVNELVLR